MSLLVLLVLNDLIYLEDLSLRQFRKLIQHELAKYRSENVTTEILPVWVESTGIFVKQHRDQPQRDFAELTHDNIKSIVQTMYSGYNSSKGFYLPIYIYIPNPADESKAKRGADSDSTWRNHNRLSREPFRDTERSSREPYRDPNPFDNMNFLANVAVNAFHPDYRNV